MMRKLMPDSCSIEIWPEEVQAAVPLAPAHAHQVAAVVAAAGAHLPLGLPALADRLHQLAAQAKLQQAALADQAAELHVQVLGPDHPILPERSKLRLITTATTEDMRAVTMCTMPTLAVAVVVVDSLLVLPPGSLSAVAAAVLSALCYAPGNGKDAHHAATEADKSMDSEKS